MYRQILTVAVLASLAFVSPQDEKKPKDDSARVIAVTGCVNHTRLDVIQTDSVGRTIQHFKMRGNKDLMKVLAKDLNGHRVEVTGTVEDPPANRGLGKTVQVGKKTTITTGARDVPAIPDPATDPTLTVSSFKDLAPACSDR